MSTFVQNIITYNISAVSILVTCILHQLTIDKGKQFSQTVRMLHQDFYVVDRNKVKYDKAITIVNKIRTLCAKRGFPNSGWTNDKWIIDHIITQQNRCYALATEFR